MNTWTPPPWTASSPDPAIDKIAQEGVPAECSVTWRGAARLFPLCNSLTLSVRVEIRDGGLYEN